MIKQFNDYNKTSMMEHRALPQTPLIDTPVGNHWSYTNNSVK